MKILTLDYDGVLVNSRKETFVGAYNVYQRLHGFKNLSSRLLSFRNFKRIDIELKSAMGEFTRMRPYCNHTCNFSSVMGAIDNNVRIPDKKNFDKYRSMHTEDKKFRNKFHDERGRLMEENFKAFQKLSPPHRSVIDDVKRLRKDLDELFILTGNKKEIVKKMLGTYGLEIPLDNIFDSYFMDNKLKKSKIVMIEHVLSITKAKPKDIIFVDDQLEYLKSVISTKAKVFLADWGFDNDENRGKARKKGIEILNKGNFYERIRSEIIR